MANLVLSLFLANVILSCLWCGAASDFVVYNEDGTANGDSVDDLEVDPGEGDARGDNPRRPGGSEDGGCRGGGPGGQGQRGSVMVGGGIYAQNADDWRNAITKCKNLRPGVEAGVAGNVGGRRSRPPPSGPPAPPAENEKRPPSNADDSRLKREIEQIWPCRGGNRGGGNGTLAANRRRGKRSEEDAAELEESDDSEGNLDGAEEATDEERVKSFAEEFMDETLSDMMGGQAGDGERNRRQAGGRSRPMKITKAWCDHRVCILDAVGMTSKDGLNKDKMLKNVQEKASVNKGWENMSQSVIACIQNPGEDIKVETEENVHPACVQLTKINGCIMKSKSSDPSQKNQNAQKV